MMFIGLVVGWISAIVLVTTKSPSALLPISALGCLAGIALMIFGMFTDTIS